MKSWTIAYYVIGMCALVGCSKPAPAPTEQTAKEKREDMLEGFDMDRNPLTRPVDTLRTATHTLTAEVHARTITPMWDSYSAIGQALAKGDSAQAGRLAEAAANKTFEIESYNGTDPQLNFLKAQLQTLKLYLASNWPKRTLAEQRSQYEAVSGASFGLFTYFGFRGQKVYRYFSKAALQGAGAYWMQAADAAVVNPYTGGTAAAEWRLTEVIVIP